MVRVRSGSENKDPKFSEPTHTHVDLTTRGREPPLPVLVRVTGVDAVPREFHLAEGVCSVGSAAHNDIILKDAAVSRTHLELSLVPEGVLICDRGSRNGTWYLGQRVERAALSIGSRLTVGRATLSFEVAPEALERVDAPSEPEFLGIVGASPQMQRLFGTIARVQGSLVPVIVEGPSGVGKELVARALHMASPAASAPFVAINCGALIREMVASELFGHQKGAFTGAQASRKGAFESADGGTLFLDEVGELPPDVQPMLLRVLERGEVRALGSDVDRPVKVRVISATNRDLRAEVASGRFREDLYFRLAVVRLQIPALSERREDIPLLARRFAREMGLADLPPAVLDQLQARAWPGNVRELRNAVQAYAVLGELPSGLEPPSGMLDAALARLVERGDPYHQQKEELLERFTRVYLRALLRRTGGNQTQAAQAAGLDRTYLGRLLGRYGADAGGDNGAPISGGNS